MKNSLHILVIYNPVSGAKKWRNVPEEITAALREKNCTWTWFETQPAKHQDFSALKGKNFDRVLVAGGDGTISEVADFLLKEKKAIPLYILAQGSANVLGWSLGIPWTLDLKRSIKKTLTAKPRAIDAFLVNRRQHGLIAVGRGYDAFLMQETDRPLKRRWGPVAYLWMALKTVFFYRARPYKITVDKKRLFLSAKLVMVVNALPVPRFLVKENDGLLNVFVVTNKHRLHMWTGKNIVIKSAQDISFQLDGEVQHAKTLQVEVKPKALLVIPA
jgi:diacylglycerol kinase family enzyme